MSTKIYNAYKYKGDIMSLMNILHTMKKKHFNAVIKRIASYPIAHKNDIHKLDDEIRKGTKSIYGGDPLSVDSSAIVFPFSTRTFLLMLFNYEGTIPKILKDYHYQNQTDPPTNISNKEWRQREQTWDKVLGYTAIPSTKGLIVEFLTGSQSFMVARAIKRPKYKKKALQEI